MIAGGDAQLTPHGVQLAVSRLTVAVEDLIKLVYKNGKAQQEMATAVLAALTKLVCDISLMLYLQWCTVIPQMIAVMAEKINMDLG